MKTILLDFDGTIHSYTSKFTHEAEIHDIPIAGAFLFIRHLIDEDFKVVIFSTRASHPDFANAAIKWFYDNDLEGKYVDKLKFTNIKIQHDIILDDRALSFNGIYPSIEFLKSFKPWNKR
jgi:hypothetical protein